jgi:ribose transport system permease protein
LICGFVNGYLIAYVKINPFVVTLGMLSIARSLAIVVTKNAMIYEFGPHEDLLNEIGGGATLGMPNSAIILLFLTLFFIYALNYTAWGRHIYAIGGKEEAARLTGVNVNLIKMSAYLLSGLMAAVSAFLMVGWLGSVTNGIAMTYELKVIASTVIGGANLMGGAGGAFGAVIGAALIEIIRNGLLLAGMDPYWQGTFVGAFIILAVLIDKFKITTKK